MSLKVVRKLKTHLNISYPLILPDLQDLLLSKNWSSFHCTANLILGLPTYFTNREITQKPRSYTSSQSLNWCSSLDKLRVVNLWTQLIPSQLYTALYGNGIDTYTYWARYSFLCFQFSANLLWIWAESDMSSEDWQQHKHFMQLMQLKRPRNGILALK